MRIFSAQPCLPHWNCLEMEYNRKLMSANISIGKFGLEHLLNTVQPALWNCLEKGHNIKLLRRKTSIREVWAL